MNHQVGSVDRVTFAVSIGVTVRTVHRWIRDGVDGIRLDPEYVGARVFINWDTYRTWQERIKAKRLGLVPAKPRKTSSKAYESLKANGYL